MQLYRIVKSEQRATDISGFGAFLTGGRWNSAGTYMLYTSENRSLALLENLVHFEVDNIPPDLYITTLEIETDPKLTYTLPDADYPAQWLHPDHLENKRIGDTLMKGKRYLAIAVRSAINTYEYNYLLNPLFPGYFDLVKIAGVDKLDLDNRLIGLK